MGYFLVALMVIILAMITGVLCRGLCKPLACRIGWHSYKYDIVSHDGCSAHAQCQWCKYEGMIDSQGNLI